MDETRHLVMSLVDRPSACLLSINPTVSVHDVAQLVGTVPRSVVVSLVFRYLSTPREGVSDNGSLKQPQNTGL